MRNLKRLIVKLFDKSILLKRTINFQILKYRENFKASLSLRGRPRLLMFIENSVFFWLKTQALRSNNTIEHDHLLMGIFRILECCGVHDLRVLPKGAKNRFYKR